MTVCLFYQHNREPEEDVRGKGIRQENKRSSVLLTEIMKESRCNNLRLQIPIHVEYWLSGKELAQIPRRHVKDVCE